MLFEIVEVEMFMFTGFLIWWCAMSWYR